MHKKHLLFVPLLLAGSLTLPSLAQDTTAPKPESKPGDSPDQAQMMAAMMELAKPGENHKLLQGLVGSWSYSGKFWMNPDPTAPPLEAPGTTVRKPIMGGRYVQADHVGKMQMPGPDGKLMDSEFKGMEVAGYDNAKKKFVSSWIDNMGTGIMMSEGTYDPATKTLTYSAEYEMMPGMKTKARQLIKIIDSDHHTMEFYENRGGKEVKVMEITYTRQK
ncbi:MAG: DUF1579 domain-containing protein [Verrucomicrobia bacterium]|nr:DUF1579 domain-containing protein [Verrucomicrobiota bacterium]